MGSPKKQSASDKEKDKKRAATEDASKITPPAKKPNEVLAKE